MKVMKKGKGKDEEKETKIWCCGLQLETIYLQNLMVSFLPKQ
jgi:hypothetical protein